MRARLLVLSVLVAFPLAACHGAAPTAKPAANVATTVTPANACGRVSPGVGAVRYGEDRQSSAVALAHVGDRVFAYVADADEDMLHTVDVDGGVEVALTKLRGRPEQVMVLGDGRVAVTLRHENEVQILEPQASPTEPLAPRCAVPVAVEPIALAATPDERTVVVTSGWSHTVSVLDGATLAVGQEIDVPREPRAAVVADDGKRVFVSHLVGAKMSVVSLDDPKSPRELSVAAKRVGAAQNPMSRDEKARAGCQGYALAKSIVLEAAPPAPVEERPVAVPPKPAPAAPKTNPKVEPIPKTPIPGRIFAPMVTVDPGDPGRIAYYGNSDGLATEVSQVPIVDEQAERVLTRSVLAPVRGFAPREPSANAECLLPRAAAVSGASLYVTCLGIDSLLELDGRVLDPARAEHRRWSVGAGPTGLALDRAKGRAVVWAQFDRSLAIVDLAAEGTGTNRIALSRVAGSSLPGDVALGRVLFHRTGDGRISTEGMACASCHPEGREDAITWGTQDGPRQTIMLSGRLDGTAPYSWGGLHQTVPEHVRDTMARLRGSGLDNAEVDALVAYVEQMPAPKLGPSPLAKDRAALIAEGARVFASSESECASCHVAEHQFADGRKHDVTNATPIASAAIETPSLRFLSGTAPYFHDGRYPTLGAMLDATDHTMGHAASLSREKRVALEAYLETL